MKKMDNKGFSLVELIIVIAIMAILIGIVGSQVIPYMEKSRVSKDMSTLDTVYTSFQAIVADYAITADMNTTYPAISGSTNDADASSELQELVGFNAADLAGKYVSKGAKGQSTKLIYKSSNKKITVQAGNLSVSNK